MKILGMIEALLDSWDRNHAITVNLLRSIPADALALTPVDGSPSIAQLFTHMHYVRLVLVFEAAPEFARGLPKDEWAAEPDRDRLMALLNDSAGAVRGAVQNRIDTDREMLAHYDHPLLMLQHLIWHEGYHHGQIKLTLKLAGRAFADAEIGPLTWAVWMAKKAQK